MSEALTLALSFVLNAGLPYLIVRYDLRRLSAERLARSWNEASLLSAVFGFGPLSLPVHFTKTRRSWAGFALGLGLSIAAFVIEALLAAGIDAAIGE